MILTYYIPCHSRPLSELSLLCLLLSLSHFYIFLGLIRMIFLSFLEFGNLRYYVTTLQRYYILLLFSEMLLDSLILENTPLFWLFLGVSFHLGRFDAKSTYHSGFAYYIQSILFHSLIQVRLQSNKSLVTNQLV